MGHLHLLSCCKEGGWSKEWEKINRNVLKYWLIVKSLIFYGLNILFVAIVLIMKNVLLIEVYKGRNLSQIIYSLITGIILIIFIQFFFPGLQEWNFFTWQLTMLCIEIRPKIMLYTWWMYDSYNIIQFYRYYSARKRERINMK